MAGVATGARMVVVSKAVMVATVEVETARVDAETGVGTRVAKAAVVWAVVWVVVARVVVVTAVEMAMAVKAGETVEEAMEVAVME